MMFHSLLLFTALFVRISTGALPLQPNITCESVNTYIHTTCTWPLQAGVTFTCSTKTRYMEVPIDCPPFVEGTTNQVVFDCINLSTTNFSCSTKNNITVNASNSDGHVQGELRYQPKRMFYTHAPDDLQVLIVGNNVSAFTWAPPIGYTDDIPLEYQLQLTDMSNTSSEEVLYKTGRFTSFAITNLIDVNDYVVKIQCKPDDYYNDNDHLWSAWSQSVTVTTGNQCN